MKKFLAVLTALAVLTSLTACSGKAEQGGGQTSTEQGMNQSMDNSSDTSTENNSDTSTDTSSDVPEPEIPEANNSREPLTGKDLVAAFKAPDGEPVDLTGVPLKDIDGNSITVDELTENNWEEIQIDGSVYLAESSGIRYDSVTNADIYNADTMEFSGVPEELKREYKKYKVGDTFGELKIAEANTSFMSFSESRYYKHFNGGHVRFDGTLTLTGKLYMAPEAECYITERDLFFEPSSDDCKKIPIMSYYANKDGNEPLFRSTNNETVYLCDSTRLSLGNMDDYPELDFSQLPMDGSWVDVKITVGDILFSNYLIITNHYAAKILDLEILS